MSGGAHRNNTYHDGDAEISALTPVLTQRYAESELFRQLESGQNPEIRQRAAAELRRRCANEPPERQNPVEVKIRKLQGLCHPPPQTQNKNYGQDRTHAVATVPIPPKPSTDPSDPKSPTRGNNSELACVRLQDVKPKKGPEELLAKDMTWERRSCSPLRAEEKTTPLGRRITDIKGTGTNTVVRRATRKRCLMVHVDTDPELEDPHRKKRSRNVILKKSPLPHNRIETPTLVLMHGDMRTLKRVVEHTWVKGKISQVLKRKAL